MSEQQDQNPEATTATDDDSAEPVKASEVTPEQLAAAMSRLDAYDAQRAAEEKRARNRARAQNAPAVLREEAPSTMAKLTDTIEQAMVVVEKAHRDDSEIVKLSVDVKKAFDTMRTDGEAIDSSIAHLSAIATGLEYGDREHGQAFPAMAAAWVLESKRLTDAHLKRYERVTKYVDGEIAHLETQAKAHGEQARRAITVTNLSSHVAQEIRSHFRKMSPTERASAVREATMAGDRETMTALLEPGVPRYLLGITGNEGALFDLVIGAAEKRFAPESVARREAALGFAARLKDARQRFHQGSERFSALAMLAKKPELKQRIEAYSKLGAAS